MGRNDYQHIFNIYHENYTNYKMVNSYRRVLLENTPAPTAIYSRDITEEERKIWIEPNSERTDPGSSLTTGKLTPVGIEALKRKIAAAKTIIGRHVPIFFIRLNDLAIVITYDIPTMAVDDCGNIYINPYFALITLNIDECAGVLIHETFHIINCTLLRKGPRNHMWWNIATDFIMNRDILMDGFSLPECGCLPKKDDQDRWWVRMKIGQTDVNIDITNMTAEGLYNKLYAIVQKQPKQPGNPGRGGGGGGQGGGKRPLNVGDKVKIKGQNKIGEVTGVNPDGTYEVNITETLGESLSLYKFYFGRRREMIIENTTGTYTRDQLIPVTDKRGQGGDDGDQGGGGGGDGMPGGGNIDDADEIVLKDDQSGRGFDQHIYTGGKPKPKPVEGAGDNPLTDTLTEGSEKQKNRNAAEAAKPMEEQMRKAGNGPGALRQAVQRELDRSKIDWRRILEEFIRLSDDRYTYTKRSRGDIITKGMAKMPSLVEIEEQVSVMVTIDTSGSISEPILKKFLSETIGIAKKFEAAHIIIVFWHTEVYMVAEIDFQNISVNQAVASLMALVKEKAQAGGTDISCIYEYFTSLLPKAMQNKYKMTSKSKYTEPKEVENEPQISDQESDIDINADGSDDISFATPIKEAATPQGGPTIFVKGIPGRKPNTLDILTMHRNLQGIVYFTDGEFFGPVKLINWPGVQHLFFITAGGTDAHVKGKGKVYEIDVNAK